MSGSDDIPSVDELFTWNPSEVQSWLDSVWSRSEQLPDGFNWLLLAEHAAQLARWNDDLEWASVSTRVYDWLHRVEGDGADLSSMFLRAYFIKARGCVSGDPVLDSNVILKWFSESLPLSFAEAQLGIPECKAKIATGNISGPDDLQLCRQLRLIKNKLNVIELLVESGAVLPDEELSKWLDVKSNLP